MVTDFMDLRVLPDTDIEYYLAPVVIWSQCFNRVLGLGEDDWSCFIIPEGSGTNGASWNPLVCTLIWMHKRSPKIRWAASGHDWLYKMAGKKVEFFKFNRATREMGESLGGHKITRFNADTFIAKKSSSLGSNFYQADMIRLGLFLGGWYAFNKYKKFNLK